MSNVMFATQTHPNVMIQPFSMQRRFTICQNGLSSANGVINAGNHFKRRTPVTLLRSFVASPGTAAGGVVLPLILPTLLDKYGSSKTLRYLSIVETVLLVMVLPFVKGRLPESRVRPPTTRTRQDTASNRAYLKNRTFWVMNAITTIQGLAYFVPILWLPGAFTIVRNDEHSTQYSLMTPAYASSLQISPSSSSLALSLLNGASVVGRLSLGILSDRVDTWLLAFTTLMSSAIAVFVLWGLLSYSFAGILFYGIAYGCLAGGFTSLWTGFTRPVASEWPDLPPPDARSHESSLRCLRGRPNPFNDIVRLLDVLPRHW